MNDQLFLQYQLEHLPVDNTHPTGVPTVLADYLSKPQRIARERLSLPWVEYRLLAALAFSGWSLRYALVEAEASNLGLGLRSGSLNRACTCLAQMGLWQTVTVRLVVSVTLVRLSPLGRSLLSQIGLDVGESDWERVERLHRGAGLRQLRHTAAICTFAYHARKRGYEVVICPQEVGNAEPDLLLIRDGQRTNVEVQGRSGDLWRRAIKWRNVGALSGDFAICALTPEQAQRYAQEARRASIHRGLVTDLATLYHDYPFDLWTGEWGHWRDTSTAPQGTSNCILLSPSEGMGNEDQKTGVTK